MKWNESDEESNSEYSRMSSRITERGFKQKIDEYLIKIINQDVMTEDNYHGTSEVDDLNRGMLIPQLRSPERESLKECSRDSGERGKNSNEIETDNSENEKFENLKENSSKDITVKRMFNVTEKEKEEREDVD